MAVWGLRLSTSFSQDGETTNKGQIEGGEMFRENLLSLSRKMGGNTRKAEIRPAGMLLLWAALVTRESRFNPGSPGFQEGD